MSKLISVLVLGEQGILGRGSAESCLPTSALSLDTPTNL